MTWKRPAFALALLPASWLAMMLLHESGHMLTALATGGTVSRLVWPLWGFSRTDLGLNPHPLATIWGGPLFGAVLPPLATLLLYALRRKPAPVSLHLFSGFCLLANGLYLSVGTLAAPGGVGDTRDLLKYSTPAWLLWLLGLTLAAAGLFQWHRLGNGFGLAGVKPTELWTIVSLAAALVIASVLVTALT